MHLPSTIYKAFVLVTLLVALQASAQQHSAGINTNNPNPNAVLHIVSSNGNQGLLIPQIGTTQRLGIDISGVENNGLLVYDNDEGQFYYAHSGSWHTLTNDADFDPSNELQTISKSGNTLTLSGNNSSINIGEGIPSTGQFLEWDGTNWVPVFPPSAQQLQFSGNELSLSNDPTSTTVDFSLWDQNASDDFSGDYIDLINQPTIPADINELSDGSGLLFSGSFTDLSNVPANLDTDFTDDFDGDYNSLINQPAIPTLTSELTNDSGFITSPDDADADASNEIQTITKSGNSLVLSVNNSTVNIGEGIPGVGQFLEWDGTNWVPVTPPTAQQLQYAGSILSLSNDPSSTTIDFSLWDQNASDDFNGDYNSLINQPAIPTLTSELTNDSGFITSPDDADADATNEIQTITAGAGITVTPTGNDYQVINSLPDQTVSIADGGSGNVTIGGTYPNLTVDVPSLDDADADATNELNTNFLVNGANLEITDAGGTLQVPLSSIDLANENQTVSAGAGININQVGQDFEVVNILPDQTVTLADGGSGNVTIGGIYPNLTVDVPSLDDADADATNEIQTITAGAGITVTPTGNDYQVINSLPDQTVTLADGGSGNVTIGGTYPNLTVDVPSLDDADADATNEIQTITAGAGITVTPTGNDYQVINSLPDQTVTIADGGSGNVTIGGTYPNLTVDVPSLDDADADATNELNTNFLVNGANLEITDAGGTLQVPLSSIDLANENQTVSAGAGININQVGQDFEVVNILPDQTVTLADGGSGNVTIGGIYPNLTVDVPSLDDADADATNEIQTITAGAGITVTPTGNDYQVINSLPDQTVSIADGGSGNVTIGGTYPNLTVDVPSLDDADADATNEIQTITAGAGITVTPTGNDYQVINSLPDQTVTLADGGSGNVTIGGTYPNLTVDVPSLDDADADATNEIQTITAGAGITVTPTGNDYQVINSLPDQTVTLADGGSGNLTVGGTYPNLTVDVPTLNDADADATNELNTNFLVNGANLEITDAGGTLQVPLSSIDLANENQTVSAGAGININQVGQDFEVVNILPDQTVTLADGGSGNVTIGGIYPNLTVDVPSLDDADADATNEIQTITAGAGITVTPTGNDYQVINSSPDQTVTLADGGSGNVTVGGTYPNLTVDVPSLDDADADATNEIQTITAGAGITVTPTGNDYQVINSLPDQTVTLADGGSGNVTIGGTYPNLTVDVPSLDDADADATNEIQTITAGAGITVTPTGNDYQVINSLPDQTVTLADGGSGNVTIGGTYPNLTVDVPSLDDADEDASNEIQTVDQLNLTGTTLNLSLLNDAVAPSTVDLSPINTDDQTVDQFNLTGNTLNLSLESDGAAPYTVDLSSFAIADQTGQNGNYLTTDGTNTSWDPLGALAQLDAVTTTEITDNTITGSDLNASVAGNGLIGGGGTPLAMNLSGTSGLQITTDQLEMPDLHGSAGSWSVVLAGSIDYDQKGRITGFGTSDERLKRDITRIEGVLEKTLKLNGYTYYYKNQPNDMLQHGVIAQELKELFPALVMENENGYYSVNFGGLVPILLEAIKEQHKIIEGLESKLDLQEGINTSQESRISDMESKLDQLLQLMSVSK